MLRRLLPALCALAAIMPAAAAAKDEIFVDPGSPSAKEYALPVDSARRQAAGTAGKGTASGQPAPLFGEGVAAESPRRSGAGSGASNRSGSGSGHGAADAAPARGARSPGAASAGPDAGPLRATAAAPDGGLGALAIVGGVGVAVLLAGAGIGLLLRRRAAPPA
jgi:hypothetical protein